ncbi:hypothetical protein FO519_004100 [Halicephalobus sp. NKZ332]|nr:hypothetical protein FO519_004100 [Halicephalobus sp. NKZ332]
MMPLRFVLFFSLFYFGVVSASEAYGCEALICLHGGTCQVDDFSGDPVCICPPKFTGEYCEVIKKKDGDLLKPYRNLTNGEIVYLDPISDDRIKDVNVASLTPKEIREHRRRIENEIRTSPWTLIMISFAAMMILALTIVAMIIRGRRKKVVRVTHVCHPPCLVTSDFSDDRSHDFEKPARTRTRLNAFGGSGSDDTGIGGDSSPVSSEVTFTKLHEAVSGKIGMLEFTSDLHRCINVRDDHGRLALHWAADAADRKCEEEIVADINFLISAGEDINAVDNSGRTPFHYAVRRGRKRVAIRLMTNTNVDLFDNYGKNPLFYAVNTCQVEVVEHMLKNFRVDVNYVYDDNETILHKTIRLGRDGIPILKLLINICAIEINSVGDRHAVDYMGITPLHVAAQYGNVEAIKLIRNKVNNMNLLDRWSQSPLHYAVENNHVAVVRYLVTCGANTMITSDYEETPLSLAQKKGYTEMVQLLHNGKEIEPIFFDISPNVLLFIVSCNFIEKDIFTAISTGLWADALWKEKIDWLKKETRDVCESTLELK